MLSEGTEGIWSLRWWGGVARDSFLKKRMDKAKERGKNAPGRDERGSKALRRNECC